MLVEFWTFGCYNCRHVEPYVKQWHQRHGSSGLVVALDNDFSNRNRYGNRYWRAIHLIDKSGLVRHVKIGEGDYEETERIIKELLAEE